VVAALKIAEATALRLLETRLEGRPVLSNWEALQDYLQAAIAHSPVEEVRVLFLNAKNMLIANRRRGIDACPRSHEACDGEWRDRDHHRPQSPKAIPRRARPT
jgi:DNA repair protein RadC